MKAKVLLFSLFCLAAASCFAQDTVKANTYFLPHRCHAKVMVYQSINHRPELAHYKYMSPRYWIIRTDRVVKDQNTEYVRVYIPDNEMVREAEYQWTDDGKTIDHSDYNTWLYIKKSDLDQFKSFRFAYSMESYFPQPLTQTAAVIR